jgi:hypothetical protein
MQSCRRLWRDGQVDPRWLTATVFNIAATSGHDSVNMIALDQILRDAR